MTSVELRLQLRATLLGLGDLSVVDSSVGRISPISQLKRILEQVSTLHFDRGTESGSFLLGTADLSRNT